MREMKQKNEEEKWDRNSERGKSEKWYSQEEWRLLENVLKAKSPNLPNWTVNKIFIVLFTI